MRKLFVFATVVFILLATRVSAQPDNELVGTWEFLFGTYTHGDGSTSQESAQEGVRALKIVSQTHFCLIAQWENGTMNNALGGTYEVDGDHYTENIEYSAYKANLGLKGEFTYSLEEDKLQIEGTVGKAALKEVWRRIGTFRGDD